MATEIHFKCPKCSSDFIKEGQVGFNDYCEDCLCYFHSCIFCKYHLEDSGNCSISSIEIPKDRENKNLCEEYQLGGSLLNSSEQSNENARKSLKKLDSLFKKTDNDEISPQQTNVSRKDTAKEKLNKLFKDI